MLGPLHEGRRGAVAVHLAMPTQNEFRFTVRVHREASLAELMDIFDATTARRAYRAIKALQAAHEGDEKPKPKRKKGEARP
jgi:hypothetical protein